jgi:hypothetical protein
MTEQHSQTERLEDLLAEVQRLKQARVFDRTPVDPTALLEDASGKQPRRRVHRLFVALQAAACVALLIGLASLWRSPAQPTSLVNNGGPAVDVGALAQCFTGPSDGRLGSGCDRVDFDHDGDVDLEDYGVFQRDYASSR